MVKDKIKGVGIILLILGSSLAGFGIYLGINFYFGEIGWHLKKIDIEDAWEITQGSKKS